MIGTVIPAIVLAAGKSTRMGRPKANLPLENGETFLSRIVRTLCAAAVDDVVVVVGHEADAIVTTFSRTGAAARFVTNTDYENGGQFSSLLRGLSAVDRPGVIAALVTLVDVPFVNADTVRAVIDRYHQTHAPIVRPVRGRGARSPGPDRAFAVRCRCGALNQRAARNWWCARMRPPAAMSRSTTTGRFGISIPSKSTSGCSGRDAAGENF